MSPLLSRLLEDIKTAMKALEKDKLICLRSFHSEVKNVGINQAIEITDDVVLQVAQKFIKQRKDAKEQFEKGGRQDLVDSESKQIDWISVYLPTQMSETELEGIVRQVIEKVGAKDKKDMSKVMKEVMPLIQGRADGKSLSAMVGRLLG